MLLLSQEGNPTGRKDLPLAENRQVKNLKTQARNLPVVVLVIPTKQTKEDPPQEEILNETGNLLQEEDIHPETENQLAQLGRPADTALMNQIEKITLKTTLWLRKKPTDQTST